MEDSAVGHDMGSIVSSVTRNNFFGSELNKFVSNDLKYFGFAKAQKLFLK